MHLHFSNSSVWLKSNGYFNRNTRFKQRYPHQIYTIRNNDFLQLARTIQYPFCAANFIKKSLKAIISKHGLHSFVPQAQSNDIIFDFENL